MRGTEPSSLSRLLFSFSFSPTISATLVFLPLHKEPSLHISSPSHRDNTRCLSLHCFSAAKRLDSGTFSSLRHEITFRLQLQHCSSHHFQSQFSSLSCRATAFAGFSNISHASSFLIFSTVIISFISYAFSRQPREAHIIIAINAHSLFFFTLRAVVTTTLLRRESYHYPLFYRRFTPRFFLRHTYVVCRRHNNVISSPPRSHVLSHWHSLVKTPSPLRWCHLPAFLLQTFMPFFIIFDFRAAAFRLP